MLVIGKNKTEQCSWAGDLQGRLLVPKTLRLPEKQRLSSAALPSPVCQISSSQMCFAPGEKQPVLPWQGPADHRNPHPNQTAAFLPSIVMEQNRIEIFI